MLLVSPNLGRPKQFRRITEMSGKPGNRIHVVLLGNRRQITHLHVFNHALT
jgi:hypothetical protein